MQPNAPKAIGYFALCLCQKNVDNFLTRKIWKTIFFSTFVDFFWSKKKIPSVSAGDFKVCVTLF